MSSVYCGPRIFTALIYNYDATTPGSPPQLIVSPDEVVWGRTWVLVYWLDPETKGLKHMISECLNSVETAQLLAARLFKAEALDPGLFVQGPSVVWAVHTGPLKWLERYAKRISENPGPVILKSLVDEAYQEPTTIEQRRGFNLQTASRLLLLRDLPSTPMTLDVAFNTVVSQHLFFTP